MRQYEKSWRKEDNIASASIKQEWSETSHLPKRNRFK